MRKFLLIILSLILSLMASHLMATEIEYKITIKNHQLNPKNLEIPSNKRIRITVENLDSTIEEFHSDDLRREKIIGANKQAQIMIGPLRPGVYKYMGEFHAKTAQGTITAK